MGYNTINFAGGGGYSGDVITKDELLDDNGKIKSSYIDASITADVVLTQECTDASNTPVGQKWKDSSTSEITGMLLASVDTRPFIYMFKDYDATEYTKFVTIYSESEQIYKWAVLEDPDEGIKQLNFVYL